MSTATSRRRSVPVSSAKEWLIAMIVAGVVLAVIIAFNRDGPPAPATTAPLEMSAEARESVEHLLRNNIARVDIQLHKVWIDPLLWAAADAATKEEIASRFALYFSGQNKKTVYRCEIFDSQSGKRLARYSQAFGFRAD